MNGITYRDHLVNRARSHWGQDNPLPLDLFAEMGAEGIDVTAEENTFHQQQGQL